MIPRVKKNRRDAWLSRSVAETRRIASGLAGRLRGGELILVNGPVGAGKTTFIAALAKSLGVNRRVRSPSFVLFSVYPARRKRIEVFIHADCYRLKRRPELSSLGLAEYIKSDRAVVAVEWSSRFPSAWSGQRLVRVSLASVTKTARRVVVRFEAPPG